MLNSVFKKVFGTSNDRFLKTLAPTVAKINELEPQFAKLNDQDLRRHTLVFKERLARGETLEQILPEVFAVVRQAAQRTLGMRHYDVQLIGGMVLHRGMIAEMKTGEGKTLMATLPVYLNALSGKGVHVVTVNDYLAKRDAEWMGQIYNFLGMDVGVIYSGMPEEDKRSAYQADITYGQNNEFGFDYLRDNLKFSKEDLMQRGHNYALVDEVDSILIDEARTPLIISGPAEDSSALYSKVNKIIPKLQIDLDYEMDLKTKNPTLTEAGIAKAEELLAVENLYDPTEIETLHHVNQSLKAYNTMHRDIDYVVKNGQVIIVDEFTGRLMPGRRWSDGLHQAIEAKEGVKIARENRTLASITFQNLFRMYGKLSGMTGTAMTEAAEFKTIYNLDVAVIPTNLQLARKDIVDVVYRTNREKYDAVIEEIVEANSKGQPTLVGTTNIEQSELLSSLLVQKSIPHHVLNAKHHQKEAEIVAQAGRYSAVTIATNMAGRGTDIVLGGNPEHLASSKAKKGTPEYEDALVEAKEICAKEKQEVLAAGGLYIIGTERHESRRIDNQLRGRAGRQGDPGRSLFYISLEDNLMKRFGGDRYQELMKKMGWKEGLAIDSRIISKTIENAQARVERYHFESRKQVTEYDDVLNKQRKAIYNLRSKVLDGVDLRSEVLLMIDDLLEDTVLAVCSEDQKPNLWDLSLLEERYKFLFNHEVIIPQKIKTDQQAIFDHLRNEAKDYYKAKALSQQAVMDEFLADNQSLNFNLSLTEAGKVFDFKFTTVEQETVLELLDQNWNSHLQQMDFLREGIGLRGYAQQNPLHEYQKEGYGLFTVMLDKFKEEVVRKLAYFDADHLQKLIQHFMAEHQRREEIQRQMELAGVEDKADEDGKITSFLPKDPEEARAKLQERKKMRKKMR